MRKVPILFAALMVTLFVGCATGSRRAKRELLCRHPLAERRISVTPTNNYTPAGVWRISGSSNVVYLAGTSHLVAADQAPFPSPFYAAYNDSREIYVEYDTHSFFGQLRMIPKAVKWVHAHKSEFLCPRGATISNYVSPETLAKLEAHYGKKELRKHEKGTPLLLLFLNEFEAMTDEGEMTSGVEDVFMIAARRDGKPLHALDDKQVIDTAMLALDEIVAGLRADIAERGVDAVIEDKIIHPTPEDPQDDLWRKGNLEGIEKFQEEMKTESPEFFKKGLVERNRKWMPRIEAALRGKHNAMVLVGCGHLGGEIGLLKLLRDAGYEPQQLYGVDRPE
jgi:uncharacterized protein YbaP (TraB family)